VASLLLQSKGNNNSSRWFGNGKILHRWERWEWDWLRLGSWMNSCFFRSLFLYVAIIYKWVPSRFIHLLITWLFTVPVRNPINIATLLTPHKW